MPTLRAFAAAAEINGQLYVVGGVDNLGVSARLDVYNPNDPPVADAGDDQTVECASPGGTSVTLDGSGSTDIDEDTLTYTWTEGATTLAMTTDPTTMATVALDLGTHTITLTVDDGNGGMDSDTVDVTVQDTTAPNIGTATASPSSLWPPNHKMMPVTVTASVSDICDAAPTCEIISVSSNEPLNGLGDGDTVPDWVITGDLTVDLRAERAGTGSGRVYTITVECADASGNSSTKTVDVTVPHDRRK